MLRGEGPMGQPVTHADAPGDAAAITLRAFLAANAPGADALQLGGIVPTNIPMSDYDIHRSAERADQRSQMVQKELDLLPGLKESRHAGRIT